jgi:hypothetical protein
MLIERALKTNDYETADEKLLLVMARKAAILDMGSHALALASHPPPSLGWWTL